MGVKRTYLRLFDFCDIKSWTADKNSYNSKYYKEYKLEFLSGDTCWLYRVYPASYTYSHSEYIPTGYISEYCHQGIVTLNGLGKFIWTWSMFISFLLIQNYIFKVPVFPYDNLIMNLNNHCVLYIGYIFVSHILSLFIYSVFNWKLYRILKKVEYVINNAQAIKEKEDQEILYKKIVSIVNNKVSTDPKLARRIKLKQLNKIPFWKKVRKIFDDDGGYPPLIDD